MQLTSSTRRNAVVLAAVSATIAAGIAGLVPRAAVGSPADPSGRARTIRLVGHPTGFHQIDTGHSGPSVGDEVFEHGRLTGVGGTAGRFMLSATLVQGPATHPWESQHVTFRLAGGSLEALGQHVATDDYALAVVGGTGDYAGASGTVWMHGASRSTTVVVRLR